MPALHSRTSTSLSAASDTSEIAGVSRHLVSARCLAHADQPGGNQWPLWLATCYRLTPQRQQFGPHAALLDLGTCTDAEAVDVVNTRLTQLQHQQVILRAALASSGTLAQFALLHAPVHEPLTLLTTERVPALLRVLSITALTQLQLAETYLRRQFSDAFKLIP